LLRSRRCASAPPALAPVMPRLSVCHCAMPGMQAPLPVLLLCLTVSTAGR
jgi:hypothetical protein